MVLQEKKLIENWFALVSLVRILLTYSQFFVPDTHCSNNNFAKITSYYKKLFKLSNSN